MLRVVYSNRTEALLARLIDQLRAARAAGADPLAPTVLVVPNRHVERYLELGIARSLGIAANLRVLRLRTWAAETLGDGGPLLDRPRIEARLLHLLAGPLDGVSLEPLARYLGEASDEPGAGRRRAQLAMHLAGLFEAYGEARPDLLQAWEGGARRFGGTRGERTERWQAELWRRLRALEGPPSLRGRLAEGVKDGPATHVFGLSYLPPVHAALLGAVGAARDVWVYALNPCREFWEDLETGRARPGEAALRDEEDPFALGEGEQPLLRRFGRPGREHVRLLDALTGCDFEDAFDDPLESDDPPSDGPEGMPLFADVDAPTLLARLQHDVLARAPERRDPAPARGDDSLQVVEAPSVRREVETLAADIWAMVERDETLSFRDIAVLVQGPERERYLAQIDAVFEAAQGLPHHLTDLPLVSASGAADATLRLLALPLGKLTRADVLALLTHPSFAGRPPNVEPEAWVDLTARLAIFHGLDRSAHAGTYVGGDQLSWDQGLTRLALGAFLDDEAPVTLGETAYHPEPIEEGDGAAGEAAYAQVVRSLTSDVRFARETRLPLADWARLFGALVGTYLAGQDDFEAGALRRVQDALATLADLDHAGDPVPYETAEELARRAIEDLVTGRGQALADGVAVSSLVPMRALPFRVIFILGLGEGRFPSGERPDAMDLRSIRRRAGDVSPTERDRYAFLEALLCARDRLVLSYVGRDEQTGERLAPSVVVEELLEVIATGYLSDARARLTRRPALWRHEEAALTRILPSAGGEREAARTARTAEVGDLRRLDPEGQARVGLIALPEAVRGQAQRDRVRLSWASLRRFLESPLQGWASAALRLDPDDADDPGAVRDEPFAPDPRVEMMVLRAAFAEAAFGGDDPGAAYRRRVAREQARGRWPLDAIGGLFARRHHEVLAAWSAQLADLAADERGWAARRLRFGAALARERSEQVFPPVVLTFDDDPRDRGSGRPLTVELVGGTELLVGPHALTPLKARRSARRDRLRYGLRGLLAQVAIAAAGLGEDPFTVLLLDGAGRRADRLVFDPWSAASAKAWLTRLTADLLGEAHAYRLPCEVVFDLEPGAPRRGRDLLAAWSRIERRGGGSSRFGPVRDHERVPPPTEGEAEALVEARFGPILDRLREESR